MTGPRPEPRQLPHGITREVLESDELRRAVRACDPDVALIDDRQMRASIDAMLDTRPPAADVFDGVWLFGYGSLLWNPCVTVAEWRAARLYGYHRDFQIKLIHGRGSPDAPGLMLGLVPGGSCQGQALRLPGENLEHELLMVWRREMLTGVYVPRWVELHAGDVRLPAITFVANPRHASYCGRLSDAKVIELLATGSGMIGSAAEYLTNTVAHLDAQGIHDRRLRNLRARVAAWCRRRTALGSGIRVAADELDNHN